LEFTRKDQINCARFFSPVIFIMDAESASRCRNVSILTLILLSSGKGSDSRAPVYANARSRVVFFPPCQDALLSLADRGTSCRLIFSRALDFKNLIEFLNPLAAKGLGLSFDPQPRQYTMTSDDVILPRIVKINPQ